MSDARKKEDNKKAVKILIKRLHEGENPEKIKDEGKDILKSLTPHEIGMIEQELIEEGMPREEVHRLCDVHLDMFGVTIGKSGLKVAEWHPVHILMEEHNMMLGFAEKLRNITKEIKNSKSFEAVGSDKIEELNHVVHHLKDSESHYLREENVLFPLLEKHGIKEPPAVMWMEHDKIRGIKKEIYKLADTRKDMAFEDFAKQLEEKGMTLSETMANHFYKENNVLYPMGLDVIGESEWKDIRKGFDDLGYCCFTPKPSEILTEKEKIPEGELEGLVNFETGSLPKEDIESIFNALPVDITFVDKEDTVRYFSQSKDRIFVRTKAVIGRKVQQCHPQKSVHVVNKILDDFKTGKRDIAEFWINLKGRLVLIRYFPVRDRNGKYAGCLEVTQDITDIKKIEGEKRLLD